MAPATAKFAERASEAYFEENTHVWVVKSHVDSENSFGAFLRTRYTCKLKQTNPTAAEWQLVDLRTN
jgi:hypothetical protein